MLWACRLIGREHRHDITDPEEEDDYDMHPDAETLPGIPADEEFYAENWLTTKISH